MKRIISILVMMLVVPHMAYGYSYRIAAMMQEKQKKIEELEKCSGTAQGLMIAGLSTLGVSAIGVAGNIVEAKVLNDYKNKLTAKDKEIDNANNELDKKRAEEARKKAIDITITPGASDKSKDQKDSKDKKDAKDKKDGKDKPKDVKDKDEAKPDIAESAFEKQCKKLKGTYKDADMIQEGKAGYYLYPVYDACYFKIGTGLKSKCDELKKFVSNASAKLSVYSERSEFVFENDESVRETFNGYGCIFSSDPIPKCYDETDDCFDAKTDNCIDEYVEMFKNGVPSEYKNLERDTRRKYENKFLDAKTEIALKDSINTKRTCPKGMSYKECVGAENFDYFIKSLTLQQVLLANCDDATRARAVTVSEKEMSESADDEKKTENEQPVKKHLTESEKIICNERVFKSFISGVPAEYSDFYNKELKKLENIVATDNGTLSGVANGIVVRCKKGQKYKDCENAERGLSAIAKHFTLTYAQNEKCEADLPIDDDIVITPEEASDCKDRIMKMLDKDATVADYIAGFDGAKKYVKNIKMYFTQNREFYFGNRSAVCQFVQGKTIDETVSNDCLNILAKRKLYETMVNDDCEIEYIDDVLDDLIKENDFYMGLYLECVNDYGAEGYDIIAKTCTCIEGRTEWYDNACRTEKDIKCRKMGGVLTDGGGCSVEDYTNLSIEDACFAEGGKMEGTKCICPGTVETFDTDLKICNSNAYNTCINGGGKKFDKKTEECTCPNDKEWDKDTDACQTKEYMLNKRRCAGLNGQWDNGNCYVDDNTKLSISDACFIEGGTMDGDTCICPEKLDVFDVKRKVCEQNCEKSVYYEFENGQIPSKYKNKYKQVYDKFANTVSYLENANFEYDFNGSVASCRFSQGKYIRDICSGVFIDLLVKEHFHSIELRNECANYDLPDYMQEIEEQNEDAHIEYDNNKRCVDGGAIKYDRGECICPKNTEWEDEACRTAEYMAGKQGCERYNGTWNGKTCNCPADRPFWEADQNVCIESPVINPTNESPFMTNQSYFN